MEFSNETALLQEIYKGAVMGTEAIQQLLPKVENPSFRSDLQTQYQQYQQTAANAESQLKELSRCPKELTGREKAMLWGALQGQTMCNKETSHLAEMMIQGSNMGIINLTKVLNSYTVPDGPAENGSPEPLESQKARELAQSTIQAEENNINRLKAYLQ